MTEIAYPLTEKAFLPMVAELAEGRAVRAAFGPEVAPL